MKNRLQIKKNGYATPAKAISQNFAGEIYRDKYDDRRSNTKRRFTTTNNLVAMEIFPLDFVSFFFDSVTYLLLEYSTTIV